jgi:hypothetical protein
VADEAFFQLDPSGGAGQLVVRGMVPQAGDDAGFTTEVQVLLEGREIDRRQWCGESGSKPKCVG